MYDDDKDDDDPAVLLLSIPFNCFCFFCCGSLEDGDLEINNCFFGFIFLIIVLIFLVPILVIIGYLVYALFIAI